MYIPVSGGTVIWQWGRATINGTSIGVLFPVEFPTAADIITFNASALDVNNAGMYLSGISTLGFTVNSPASATATIYWVAIGH
jgi:hypothetical protein